MQEKRIKIKHADCIAFRQYVQYRCTVTSAVSIDNITNKLSRYTMMHVDNGTIQHRNNMMSRYELMRKPA